MFDLEITALLSGSVSFFDPYDIGMERYILHFPSLHCQVWRKVKEMKLLSKHHRRIYWTMNGLKMWRFLSVSFVFGWIPWTVQKNSLKDGMSMCPHWLVLAVKDILLLESFPNHIVIGPDLHRVFFWYLCDSLCIQHEIKEASFYKTFPMNPFWHPAIDLHPVVSWHQGQDKYGQLGRILWGCCQDTSRGVPGVHVFGDSGWQRPRRPKGRCLTLVSRSRASGEVADALQRLSEPGTAPIDAEAYEVMPTGPGQLVIRALRRNGVIHFKIFLEVMVSSATK